MRSRLPGRMYQLANLLFMEETHQGGPYKWRLGFFSPHLVHTSIADDARFKLCRTLQVVSEAIVIWSSCCFLGKYMRDAKRGMQRLCA